MHLSLLFTLFTFTMVLGSAIKEEDIASILHMTTEMPRNLTLLESWDTFEKQVKTMANLAVKLILPYIMENTGKMNLSSECMQQSMQLLSGLKSIKPWAIRFFDSSAKFLDGALIGSMSSLGSYDECVDTVVKSTRGRNKGQVLFTGQYCSINFKPALPPKSSFYKLREVLPELKNFSHRDTAVGEGAKYAHFFHFVTYRMGICVPSGCTLNDIDQLAKKVVKDVISLEAIAARCEVKEENEFTPLVIGVIICFSFAGLLMLIGSLIDLYSYYKKIVFRSKIIRILVAFSLFTNFRKFVNTKTASGTLSCLNGIRFLCMSWIILGHTYLYVNYQIFLGLQKVQSFAEDFAFQAVTNASVAVDTFFCIGGLLVCYLTIRLVRIQKHEFSISLYIFHRLWRLYPVYIFVILFIFLGDLFGSGPLWHDTTDKHMQHCFDNWWTNLLFINNVYNAKQMCIPHSWYIACDVQLYIAALLILLPMLRWPKVGISLSILGITVCIVYTGVKTYLTDFPPTMLFVHPDPFQRDEYYANLYFKPFTHAGPYFIGILSGYLLATKPDLKIPMIAQVVGWSLAFIFNFSVLYGVAEWNKGVEPTLLASLFYASFNRVSWTLGVAWMIIACATGHGGVINYILSWKAFIPLGRLTYIAYLIHPLVQLTAIGNVRTRIQPDHFFATWIFLGHLFITYAGAFAGSMLIESPFMALEKIIFHSFEKKEDNAVERKNSVLNGVLHAEKNNGDIASIVPKNNEEVEGIENIAVIYRL